MRRLLVLISEGIVLGLTMNATSSLLSQGQAILVSKYGIMFLAVQATYFLLAEECIQSRAIALRAKFRTSKMLSYFIVCTIGAAVAAFYWLAINRLFESLLQKTTALSASVQTVEVDSTKGPRLYFEKANMLHEGRLTNQKYYFELILRNLSTEEAASNVEVLIGKISEPSGKVFNTSTSGYGLIPPTKSLLANCDIDVVVSSASAGGISDAMIIIFVACRYRHPVTGQYSTMEPAFCRFAVDPVTFDLTDMGLPNLEDGAIFRAAIEEEYEKFRR